MPLENDIQSFILWANKLGCPLENMPSNEALKSIFKSQQSTFLFDLMDKVRPAQEVTLVTKNILLSKMEKLKDQVIPKCQRNEIPHEMKRYLKIQDLKKLKIELDLKLELTKSKSDPKLIAPKNLQKNKMVQVRENLQTRLNILELKLKSLKEDKKKEIEYRDKILRTRPVKLNSVNCNENLGAKAVTESLLQLDEFSKIFHSSSDLDSVNQAKTELWIQLKKLFLDVPNSVIWDIVMRLKQEQIECMKNLNTVPKLSNNHNSIYDMEIYKLKASIISLAAKYVNEEKISDNLHTPFEKAVENFTTALQFKFHLFSPDMTLSSANADTASIIANFIDHYSRRSYNKAENNYLTNEIAHIKELIENNANQLDNHPIVIASLKRTYDDISIKVQRIKQEIIQLGQINSKIHYSQSQLQYILNDCVQVLQQQKQKRKSFSTDSLNISDVMCSTKLNLDCTTNSNTTIRNDNNYLNLNGPVNSNNIFPPNLTELSIFMDIPIENLKSLPKECWPHLLSNPLIAELPDSMFDIQFYPEILLTSDGALKLLRDKQNWYNQIKSISENLNTNYQLIEVNEQELKQKAKQQTDDLAEILDKIDIIGNNTKQSLNKAEKYYKFLLNTPLKHYIPPNKLLNRRSYVNYDSEYNMYYRMAREES